MKNHNLSSKLHLIENKVLIMGGDNDNIAPIEGQVVFEKYLKNSSLYLIKDGSHVPPEVDFHETVNEKNKLLHKLDEFSKQTISSRNYLSFFILFMAGISLEDYSHDFFHPLSVLHKDKKNSTSRVKLEVSILLIILHTSSS